MRRWRKHIGRLLVAMPKKGPQKPRPFAGAYPTRWIVGAQKEGSKTAFSYFGKPNTAVARYLERIRGERGWYVKLIEFDQNSVVQVIDTLTPTPIYQPRFWSPELVAFYYPQRGLEGIFSLWLKKSYSLRLKVEIQKKVREFTVYSGWNNEKLHVQALEAYKLWLQKANIIFE